MKLSFYLFIFFCLFLTLSSQAQQGDLYLYNYQIPIKNIDNQNHAVTQGKNGIMYFANKKGVLSYDGVSWQIVTTANTPYSLATDKNHHNRVFVGCRESFGYLSTDKRGIDFYKSISNKYSDFGEIIQIFLLKDVGYFYSDRALFKVNLNNLEILKVWRSYENESFQGIAMLNDKVYIQILNKGLHELRNEKFELIKDTEMYAGLYIRTAIEFDKNKILLGMSNNWGYFFDGKKMQLYLPIAKEYLKGNVINTGINLSSKEFALGTVSGGVIVINKEDYSTKTILNYQTGLPDDEVFAMSSDMQGGLWICHAKGITRADVTLPIRNFSGYAGLEGNLESVITWDNLLLVATGDGLYYLNKVDRFEQIENLIRKEQKYLKQVETVTKTVKVRNPETDRKVRVFNHSELGQKQPKRKIEILEEVETKEIPRKTIATEVSTTLFSTTEARKAYALQSIPFIYKKVRGLDAKVKQLIKFQDKILIASNLGLYELEKDGDEFYANPVLQNEYINFIYPSPTFTKQIYVATNNGVSILEKQDKYWNLKQQSKDMNTPIFSIVEFQKTLWAGAESQVFKIPILNEGRIGESKSYGFKDSYSENVTVRIVKGEPAFILTSGIYSYSKEKDFLFKNSHLQKYFNPYSPVLYHQPDYTWLKKAAWQNLSHPTDKDELKTVFMEFFDDVKDVYVDHQKNIWLISNNLLYQINASAQMQEFGNFNVFIRNAIRNLTNDKDEYLPLETLTFNYHQKGISFSFKMASPFYRNEPAIEYQYWLEGLSESWTDWDNKAVVSYPYVPVGKYKLHVRARNIFGQTSKEQIFAFEIKPPFWETYWFYGLQFSILAGLLLLSFFFNRAGKNPRLSIIITLIALITLFEFFTLYFEPYVDNFANGIPIFKLAMNILLAFVLLPIEHWLRHWLQRPAKRITVTPEDKVPEREIKQEQTETSGLD